MKPLVALSADVLPHGLYRQHMVPDQYVDAAVDVAGVVPVIAPSIGDRLDLDALLDRMDGVLVTGAKSNVHPSHYGAEPTAAHEPFDPDRDATTLPLIRRAVERGVPLLAICRGIQELNVAFGGSVTAAFQEARDLPDHSYPDRGTTAERFAIAHDVRVRPGSCIAEVLGGDAKVNSLHKQALDRLGARVEVEATADDGTVEAVTIRGAPGWVVGVQWHPEYWAHTDAASRRVLEAFGDACRAHAADRAGMREAAE